MALERRRWIRYTFLLLHSCYEIQVLILLRRSFTISIETISFHPGSYTYSYHYSPFPVKCHHLHLRSTEMFYAGTQERLLRGSWLYEDHRLRVPILNCGGSRIEERDSEEEVLWYRKMNSELCAIHHLPLFACIIVGLKSCFHLRMHSILHFVGYSSRSWY